MACGVKRHCCPANAPLLTIGDAVGFNLSQTVANNGQGIVGGQIAAHPPACVIRVAVRDQRAIYLPPRINIEISGRAVDAFWGKCKYGLMGHAPLSRRLGAQGQP